MFRLHCVDAQANGTSPFYWIEEREKRLFGKFKSSNEEDLVDILRYLLDCVDSDGSFFISLFVVCYQ